MSAFNDLMKQLATNTVNKAECKPVADVIGKLAVAWCKDNGIELMQEQPHASPITFSPDEPPPEREQWMMLDRTGFYFWCNEGHPDRFRARIVPIADAQGRPYKREKP